MSIGWRIQKIARESRNPLVLVGHSLGGMLARSIAVRFPQRVRHLVMLGTPSRTESWTAIRPEWRPAVRAAQSLWSALGPTLRRCGTPQCECLFALRSAPLPDTVGLSFHLHSLRRDHRLAYLHRSAGSESRSSRRASELTYQSTCVPPTGGDSRRHSHNPRKRRGESPWRQSAGSRAGPGKSPYDGFSSTGLASSTLSKIENNLISPTYDSILKLAHTEGLAIR